MQGESLRKKWPICPKQVITYRDGCPYSSDSDELGSFSVNKCHSCGIMTESTALGRLYTLFRSMRLPTVLYERVQCNKILNKVIVQNRGSYKKGRYGEVGYYDYDGSVYHSIDCDEVYDTLNTACYAARKNNAVMDNKCVENDLSLVHKLYNICEQGNLETLRTWGDISVEGAGFYYQIMTCKDAQYVDGNETPLEEVLIPLFGDSPEKGILTYPLAILFVGQLNPDFECKCFSEHNTNIISMSAVEMLEMHGQTLASFVGSILHRTNRRRMEYLFAKQDQLQKAFEMLSHEDNAKIKEEIVKHFVEICNDFDLVNCLIFMPDLSKNYTLFEKYIANDCIHKGVELPNITVSLNKLPMLIRNGLIDADVDISDAVTGVTRGENCDIFMYRNRENTGMLLWMEWRNISIRLRDYGENFFKALLSMFFSQMMARVAEIKKENMSRFIESTRHDLSQKLGMLILHNDGFKDCLSSIGRFCRYSAENQKFMGANYQICSDYHKDMKGLYNSLGFLRRTLDSPEMTSVVKPESFQPYSKFLFNMRDQYNKDPARRGKEVFCLAPRLKDPELIADSAMVERIVSNLLHNANKYAYEGTNIYLDCYYNFKDHAYYLSVTNFGARIEIDNVFGWGVHTDQSGGGYGLAISLEYAKLHGGTIEITAGHISNPSTKPESSVSVTSMIIAKILKEQMPDYVMPSEIDKEQQKMIDMVSRTDLAREHKKNTLFTEIVSNDAESYFRGMTLTPGRLRVKSEPTYRVTFTVKIPMQELKMGGNNK